VQPSPTKDEREPGARPPFRRGARRARGALRTAGARRALRPLRQAGLRPRATDPARRRARRGCRAGGVPDAVAHRRPVRPRAREGEHLDPHARAPARRRPRPPRGAQAHRRARARRDGPGPGRAPGRRGRVAASAARTRAGGPAPAARPAAGGDRARLLRWLHAVGAGRPARPAARHDQEPDVPRAVAPARPARRSWTGDVMDVHELTAAYALDALDDDDRARFEAHLPQCERCRSELAGLAETAGALALAAPPAAPPEALRARILDAAAAVAACAAIGLGIWGATLSHRLDNARATSAATEEAAQILVDP